MALKAWMTDRAGNRLAALEDAQVGAITFELGKVAQTSLGIPLDSTGFELGDDREVQLWRPGDASAPLWIGVPWDDSKTDGARSLSVPLRGLESHLARRYVTPPDDLTFSNVDQHNIGWQLIAYTQAKDGGDLNLDAAPFALSGVTRTRSHHGYELPNILEELAAFRGLIDGFDWTIEPVAADRREWTPHYPQVGDYHDEWASSYGGAAGVLQIASYGRTRSRSKVTRAHYAIAGGDGPDRLIGSYRSPAAAATLDGGDATATFEDTVDGGDATTTTATFEDTVDGGDATTTTFGTFPDLIESASSVSTSIESQAVADGHAQAEVEARDEILVLPTITVAAPELEPARTRTLEFVYGVRPGDTFPVNIDDGLVQISGTWRAVTVTLDHAGDAVTVALQPA